MCYLFSFWTSMESSKECFEHFEEDFLWPFTFRLEGIIINNNIVWQSYRWIYWYWCILRFFLGTWETLYIDIQSFRNKMFELTHAVESNNSTYYVTCRLKLLKNYWWHYRHFSNWNFFYKFMFAGHR